ncbi:general stress protein [Bacillus solitudinis]|uniref:general stress protein n=1 Tax=Bacillus solitudinis TaxID=2014074 RepID=UPI000C23A6B9|nr:general stress protein [Bacillus solitudinis]
MEKKIIGGVFKDQFDAVNVIEQLERNGYNRNDISIFAKDEVISRTITDKTEIDVSGDTKDHHNRGKKAGKGLGIGAGAGAVLGGAAGLALLAIPGVGPIMAAGPIAAAIEGGLIGAGGGGIVGALTGAGITEEQAKEYDKYLNEGYIVILVEADQTQEENVFGTYTSHNTRNTHMYPSYIGGKNNNY